MKKSDFSDNHKNKSIETADEINKFNEDVIDTVREPLLAIDKDFKVIKASRSFYKSFKVTAGETIGKPIFELGNHQWDIPKLKKLLEKIIPEKVSIENYEVEHNFSTIGERVMLLNARQVKRAFGKEKVILLAIEDITARKDKEDILEEAHLATSGFLKNLLNHMQAPIIIWDTARIIKRFNRKFELLSGYEAAELIDKKIDFLFPKEKVASTLELLENHLDEHGVEVVEVDILTKDKSIKTVLWNSSNILDEDGKNIVATISQDISSRKQLEQKIKDSEAQFRTITENSADAIFITDKEGKYIYVNKQAVDLLGYSKEELLTFTIASISPKHRLEEYAEIFQHLYTTGSSYFEIELVKKDGSYIDSDLNAVLLPNGWIYGSCRDISGRKKMESELINSKERAEESDQLKTAFLQNISHEIRTPMNAIVGFSGILNEPGLMPEKRKQYTDIIIQSSDQLLSIIEDIISIASIESGQEQMQENKININLICELLEKQYSQKAREKNVTLRLKTALADDQAIVMTDATKFTQILTNLINNALKFTRQGYVNFGYRVKDHQLEFYVEDSGIGIPSNMQEKIFERFRQVETTGARDFGGSGLGLSISKAYVGLLGGKIWLSSEMGKGSVFYFTIPYRRANPEISPELPSIEDINLEFNTAKTILIAEDEDSSFFLLEVLLSGTGINIIRASDGLEAVELCKSNPHIDLVLMDIKMPKMDGFEATTRIKEIMPDLPIIAQTAYITEADNNRALACGCVCCMSKPIDKKLLMAKISELLHT